ncbi:MAG: right-handed parallel beta-helix repeat-containing protein [Verrucomicrobia bacterium]|nr:right-handed parallel beta-helix repeat-containing protein [Verrucomicrobiota bacterium]
MSTNNARRLAFQTLRYALALIATGCIGTATANARVFAVTQSEDLSAAIDEVQPGDRIELGWRVARGDIVLRGLHGSPTAPITITAAEPDRRPVLRHGDVSLRLINCHYVTIEYLDIEGMPEAGVVIRDRGSADNACSHLRLRHLAIRETGPQGDRDAMLITGASDIVISDCQFEAWGGSAIDLVGCHRAIINNCRFQGRDGYSEDGAIDIRGASSNVLVQSSLFSWAGREAITIGGATPADDFRPRAERYEATDVRIAGNRIIGSGASIVWSAAQDSRIENNTIVLPLAWVGRIIQENPDDSLLPCAGGIFQRNIIVYNNRVRTLIDVGLGTHPQTFVFSSNAWYAAGSRQRSRLPGRHDHNIHQVDPGIALSGNSIYDVTSTDPRLADWGADRYSPISLPNW